MTSICRVARVARFRYPDNVDSIRDRQASISERKQHLNYRHAIGPRFQSQMLKEGRHINNLFRPSTRVHIRTQPIRRECKITAYLQVSGRLDTLTAHTKPWNYPSDISQFIPA